VKRIDLATARKKRRKLISSITSSGEKL